MKYKRQCDKGCGFLIEFDKVEELHKCCSADGSYVVVHCPVCGDDMVLIKKPAETTKKEESKASKESKPK